MRLNTFFSLSFVVVTSGLVQAQTSQYPKIIFSIDAASPSVGRTAVLPAIPIGPADILTPPNGPLPIPPAAFGQPGFPQLPALPGVSVTSSASSMNLTPFDIDALSQGFDGYDDNAPDQIYVWWFSVDRRSKGLTSSGAPCLFSETPCGDAAADVFIDLGLPPRPLSVPSPFAPNLGNVAVVDGNTQPNICSGYVYPGLDLIEPSTGGPLMLAIGDELDALDVDARADANTFFSLVPPLPPAWSTTAVFVQPIGVGGGPYSYILLSQLGLTTADDLDGLALHENGEFGLQTTTVISGTVETPPWWTWPGFHTPEGEPVPPDVIYFSVTRTSAVVGQTDSRFGLPIEPGDILTLPVAPGMRPSIWIAAENLRLLTVRTNGVRPDNLDGLDLTRWPANVPYLPDCNHDGVFDAIEIQQGYLLDDNKNLTPNLCDN
jgi:hypothetical protein